MEEKITIIEGPPPEFEKVGDGWALGINETAALSNVVLTRLRTFNGPALVERCLRAWREQQPIHLEYRERDGLINHKPIVAARSVDTQEGQVLLLWVRLLDEDIKIELGYEDDGKDNPDDPDLPF